MSWTPTMIRRPVEAVVMTVLECRGCERLWLVAGDHRGDAGHRCPYCPDGTVSVVNGFAEHHHAERHT